MKKTRSMIIMAVVLALMLGAFALWKLLGKNARGTETTGTTQSFQSTEPLVKLKADDIEKIEIDNKSGKLVLKPVYEKAKPAATTAPALPVTGAATPTPAPDVLKWVLMEPAAEGLSADDVTAFGNNLLVLSVVRDLGKVPADKLSEYGLDKPEAKAVYYLSSGEKIEVLLGGKASASSTGGYYAMNKNDNRVAFVTSTADRLQQSYLNLLDKNVIAMKSDQIHAFSMKRPQDPFTLSGVSTAKESKGPNGKKTTTLFWTMTSPVKWEANDMLVTNYLNELTQLKAESFLKYEPSKAKEFGLDKPQYEITLKTADAEKTLLIGQSVSDSQAYAMIKGSPYVFKFNRSLLTQTGQSALDFYSVFAALVNISTVDKLTVTLDGKTYVSDIFNPTQDETKAAKDKGQKAPEITYTLNGQNANYENENGDNIFTKYYQSVIGVKIAGFDPDAKFAEKDPFCDILYQTRNGDPNVELKFYNRDDKTLYLVKNGVYTGLYVNRTSFNADKNLDSPGIAYALQLMQTEMAKHNNASGGTVEGTTNGGNGA